MNKTKELLSNVVVIRLFLIVLLVFYHAFAIYSGAWSPITSYPEIKAYWWLDILSYAFMLELFVFVSGYVFGYQVRLKGESKLQAKNLFWGKFKRLMIPSMIFSLLYILLFFGIKQPVYKTVYDIINGVGHMWFLPMLFWCFVGVWIIESLHFKPRLIIPLLCIFAISSFLPLPLQLSASMYYLLFFYVGYIIQRKGIHLECFYTKRFAMLTLIIFAVTFPLLTKLKENLGLFLMGGGENQIVTKVVIYTAQRFFQLLYASTGIVMMLSIVGLYLKKHAVANWMVSVGSLSFGVYLLQQFILKWLYNYTALPNILGCYWLPWVCFFITLSISLISTYFLRKTKIGLFLLG